MAPLLKAARTYFVHAMLLVLLVVAVGVLAEWPLPLLVVLGIVAFPLGVWLAGIVTASSDSSRQRLARLRPSRRDSLGIFVGLLVGLAVGLVVYNAVVVGEETAVSSTGWGWGAGAAALGAWLGKWLVGLLGSVSFTLPSITNITSWRMGTWIALFFVAVVAMLLVNQIAFLSEETGKVETAVPVSQLIVPLAILGYLGYGLNKLINNTQQRVSNTVRGVRTSPRWIVIGATFLGALLGAVLVVPQQQETSQIFTSQTVGTIGVMGAVGWLTGRRLLTIAHKPTRTLLIWALMFAAGGFGLVYNLPGETGTTTNALTVGGLMGLLVGLVQLRFNVWTFARLLGLALVGLLAAIASVGLSYGQINVLAGLFFGLLATMMIFNWIAARN